jgi:hypothetical protein
VDGVPVVPTPPVPPTTELVPPGPEDPQVTVIANTYVRTGPGTNFPAYGIAQAGATGWVIGKSEDGTYWTVRLNPDVVGAGYGWVDAAYVQATNVENVQIIAAPLHLKRPFPLLPSGAPAANDDRFVNVRSGPSTSYWCWWSPSRDNRRGDLQEARRRLVAGKRSIQYSPDGFWLVSADWVVTKIRTAPVVKPLRSTHRAGDPPPPTGTASCALVSQSPADATVFQPRSQF